MKRTHFGQSSRERGVRARGWQIGLFGWTCLLASSTALAQSVTYYPSDGTGSASMLAYEDQWPALTDYDYNDVVLQAHWRFDRDTSRPSSANGFPVQRALLTIDPVAVGGVFDNGLGLQLPASKTGLIVRRRVRTGGTDVAPIYGSWQTLTLRADVAPTVDLSLNLRELFGYAAGRINVGVAGDVAGQRLEVEFSWPVAVDLDTSLAPFDLFLFRTSTPSHEIHFPSYGGTTAMNGALFAQAGATNTVGRWYVNDRGIPAALNLQTATVFPTEATRIEAVFPEIVSFATYVNTGSLGSGNDPRTFYLRPTPAGGSKTRSTAAARPAPAAVDVQSCTLTGNRPGQRLRFDGVAQGDCVFSGCPAGQHLESEACLPDTRACAVTNGTGTETWNGTAYGACVITCNAGFQLSGSTCVASGLQGAITISSTFNLNTTPTGTRTFADGIAYRVSSLSVRTLDLGRAPNGLAAGDRVMVINLQGTAGDTANVGNYELAEVESVGAQSILLRDPLQKSYGANLAAQKVVVQRVPRYQNVTIQSGGKITASAWDGLATDPAGAAGVRTGVVAFLVEQVLNIAAGGSIDASELGYRGGVSGVSGPETVSGFSTTGGGGGGGGSGGHVGPGGAGADGAQSGTWNPTGGMQGGGAGINGGGGGGAGGGWGGNLGGAAPGGGGAGGSQSGNSGVAGGNATAAGAGGGGGAAGRDSAGGGGGGASYSALTNLAPSDASMMQLGGGAPQGAGGGGGGGQGDFTNATGGSGGSRSGLGGARGSDTCANNSEAGANGGNGGAGGGIVWVRSPEIYSSGQILARGGNGGAGGNGGRASANVCGTNWAAGGGGGGGGGAGAAGGTVRIAASYNSYGAVNATGGSGGAGGTGGGVGYAGGTGLAGAAGSGGKIAILWQQTFSGSASPSSTSLNTSNW
jgi:LruC domain-containing protein